MRKIIVLSFITLDGVMQAPGGPKEDPSGGFNFGGWVAPYGDDIDDKVMEKLMKPSDLLLGRKTFKIWEHYWPQHEKIWPGVNEVTKYVLSRSRKKSNWKNSVFLKNLSDIKKLKSQPPAARVIDNQGDDLKVWGSSELTQLLLKHDLVDELWLKIHPLILGKGKKLFDNGAIPAAFELTESIITSTGVIIAHYKRAGKVKTGTIGS